MKINYFYWKIIDSICIFTNDKIIINFFKSCISCDHSYCLLLLKTFLDSVKLQIIFFSLNFGLALRISREGSAGVL